MDFSELRKKWESDAVRMRFAMNPMVVVVESLETIFGLIGECERLHAENQRLKQSIFGAVRRDIKGVEPEVLGNRARLKLEIDETMPGDVAEFRDADGNVVASIVNIGADDERGE